MFETTDELNELQTLLDTSHAASTEHLRAIIHGDRVLSAAEVAALATGMRVVAVSSVTAAGEPRISALDGHFLHGRWHFTTSGTSAKARQLRARPAVSAAWIEGEEVALFTHGTVRFLDADGDGADLLAYLTQFYGSSPLDWGPDIVLCRVEPSWSVGYAFKKQQLLADRGLTPDQG